MIRLFVLTGWVIVVFVAGCSLENSDEVTSQVNSLIEQSQDETSAGHSGTTSPSTGGSGGGGLGGFVWKPISERDGNLVVLLPNSYRGRVTGASIVQDGEILEEGWFAGDTHNGYRPHYRFSLPGAGYGSDLTLEATLSDGTVETWSIPEGGTRVG